MNPEAWQRRRVREFSKRLKRVNSDGIDLEPLSITKDRGVILQSQKYNKRIATDSRKYIFAEDGDFAFDPMSLYYGAIGRVDGIGRGLVSPDYVVFRTDQSVDPHYLHALFRYPEMHKLYESLSETGNTFGKRRRLYWSVFEDIDLSLPPRSEQTKIAAILASMDEATEATQAVIDQLHVVKRAMMAELLTRGLPGRHPRFKQTDIGEVPEDWEVLPLASLCAAPPRYGANVRKAPFAAGGVRYVRITDIKGDGDLAAEGFAGISDAEAAEYILSRGDVLFARSGATVGKSYVYRETDGRCAHAGYLIRFQPDETKLRSEFLGQVAQSERYWRWIAESKRALAQPNVNAQEYGSFLIPVPSLAEQDEILAILKSLDDRRRVEEGYRATQETLGRGLRAVLFTGEVRVKPDPEPT